MVDSKNRSIQALRAVAALSVVIDHTITQFNSFYLQKGYFGHILQNIEGIGTVGVYVFFMISGYIMSMTTDTKPGGVANSISFMKKRLARIYPSYWVWLTILIALWSVGLALRSHDYSINKIFSSYLLLPYIDNVSDGINPILSQGWTLIYEMFFYCIFTALIALHITDSVKIITTVAIFLLLNISGRYGYIHYAGVGQFFRNGVFFFFPIGMLLFRSRKAIQATLNKPILKAVIYLISIISVAYLLLRPDNSYIVFGMVLCSLLVFISYFISDINNKLLMVLGDASYSIYLSHTLIVMAYGMISRSGRFSSGITLSLSLLVIVASTAFGLIAYYTVEKRLQTVTTRMLFPGNQSLTSR